MRGFKDSPIGMRRFSGIAPGVAVDDEVSGPEADLPQIGEEVIPREGDRVDGLKDRYEEPSPDPTDAARFPRLPGASAPPTAPTASSELGSAELQLVHLSGREIAPLASALTRRIQAEFVALGASLPETVGQDLQDALRELLKNTLRHELGDVDGPVSLRLTSSPSGVRLELLSRAEEPLPPLMTSRPAYTAHSRPWDSALAPERGKRTGLGIGVTRIFDALEAMLPDVEVSLGWRVNDTGSAAPGATAAQPGHMTVLELRALTPEG